jgi:hypothetical protein
MSHGANLYTADIPDRAENLTKRGDAGGQWAQVCATAPTTESDWLKQQPAFRVAPRRGCRGEEYS